ncbi:hypothetical protein ID866_4836 [Astraeus odoratus]|nr:hypothetical protein ID866_4836 [Astraeus odoratus]
MDVDSDSDISLLGDEDTRAKGKGKGKATEKRKKDSGKGKTKEVSHPFTGPNQAYTWEASYTRSWDTVQEDETGSLQGAVEDLMARGRRRRLLAPAAAIRRTIIRHLVLILDLSSSMTDRDMRPTRFDLALRYSREFVAEWFDQNPLGQIGVVGMRAGLGERVGNPQDVLKSLGDRAKLEPSGDPSLQNAIEMARSSMSHLPTQSSREILIIFGSLTTCDPGNIHDTLDVCIKNKIRISIVALAAEMKICRELCEKTGGQFGVAMNEGHFKDLLFELVPPPAQRAATRAAGSGVGNPPADLMMMGFPTRLPDTSPPSLCVCHSDMKSEGFLCPRCMAKVCDVPTDCDICGLMIVSSPHLARSYHHLFPVKPYEAVTSAAGMPELASTCHASTMHLLLPTLVLYFSHLVSAGSQTKGQSCASANNRLQIGTYQFYSDCDSETYCSAAGICELKGCRKDQYPFGYAQDAVLPPKCPTGQFCPDEGDACQPLLTVGSPCQLNRDDQCEAPSNPEELADTLYYGRNVNGAVCLNNVCMWTNVTVGQPCEVENTAYIAYSGTSEYIDVVSRGNCKVGLYCDAQQLICMQMKAIGESCDADKECSSFNCQSNGVCGDSADTPNEFGIWVYVIVGMSIFGGMFATLVSLFMIHRRQRDQEREKRAQYWREQNAFRQNILQMRETVRTSILSLPGNGSNRSTMCSRAVSDESSTPILQQQTYNASGLRNFVSDDGSVYDEASMSERR